VFICWKLRFFRFQILGLPSKKMNKRELPGKSELSDSRFVIDKSDLYKWFVFSDTWNAYCLAKSSD